MKKILCSILLLGGLLNPSFAQKWYEGGTLHQSNFHAWKTATYEDRLATCADFVAVIYSSEAFTPKIQASLKTIDDFRPYATSCVSMLNEVALSDDSSVLDNGVSSTFVMGAAFAGWIQLKD